MTNKDPGWYPEKTKKRRKKQVHDKEKKDSLQEIIDDITGDDNSGYQKN